MLMWIPFFVGAYVVSIFVPIECSSLINWVLISIPIASIVVCGAFIWLMIIDKKTFKRFVRGVRKVFKRRRIER